jgi:Fe-S-cluster containining protein
MLVRGTQGWRTVEPKDIYFAFADGRLTYDCVSCGSQCCRGHGYKLGLGRELDAQLAARPAVRFFMSASDLEAERQVLVSNCPPACFFLEEQGGCAIHRDYGYGAKPETCRLFPFNNMNTFGPYLIVRPHASLCPLTIVPPGERSDASRHERLRETMTAQGIGTVVGDVATTATARAAELIALEREIVEVGDGRTCTSYLEFAQVQQECKSAHFGAAERRQGTARPLPLGDFAAKVCEVMGADWEAVEKSQDAMAVHAMIAMTPALRASLLFGGWENRLLAGHVPVELVPRALTILWILVLLLREAGTQRVTYQSVMRLAMNNAALVATLMFIDSEVEWRRSEMVHLRAPDRGTKEHRRYMKVVTQVLARGRKTSRRSLGDVLVSAIPETGLDRILILRRMADRIAGRLTRPQDNTMPGWNHVRPRLQQWILRGVSSERF